MMKNLAIAFLLLISSHTIFAQKDLPAFGKIDKADLLLNECEYDKEAVAYKLLDYGDVRYVSGKNIFKISTERRIRIKILKDKGLEYANIKIKFYSKQNFQDISNISGITYNLDNSGNVVTTKLDKGSIYKKPLNNRFSEVVFTMPEVKAGSVIEYKYSDARESYSDLDDWYFQDEIPTRTSVYKILVPSIFRFVTQVFAYQKVDVSKNDVYESLPTHGGLISYNSVERTYIIKNVPALRDEPFMGASKDYLQRVIFQLSAIIYPSGETEEVMSTWPKLTKELLDEEDFGVQLRKNIPHTSALDDSLKLLKDKYKRMVAVYTYVQRNMNWNGSESLYSADGIKSAWDKKSGNNTEINLILINLLRDAGLDANPLLVSTKDHGSVNTVYPFLEQFNNTMACVTIDNKRYILNGADKYNPAYLIPYDVLNNEAFVVDNNKGGWIKLDDDTKDKYINMVSLFSEITPDGLMKGQATVFSAGYCKNPRVKKWKEDKTDFSNYFSKAYTGVKVDTIEVNNADVDTLPLEQKVQFSLPINQSGEYEYFPLNLFQGLEKNPFIADERYTDIDFGYKQSFQIVGKIYIPDGYEFDELPKNIRMIMPDTSIVLKRMMQSDGNSIDLKISVDFEKPVYAATDYPLFKEFYKKLFTTLNEQVVIKKKKATP